MENELSCLNCGNNIFKVLSTGNVKCCNCKKEYDVNCLITIHEEQQEETEKEEQEFKNE